MAAIFISYRREDSAGYAGRLYDIVSAHFGKGEVFIDVDEIPAGADFVKIIEQTEDGCSVLLVVIGKAWLIQGEDGRPRLFDPQDFVRLEITTGINRRIRLIPLLVGGAAMPRVQQVPEELAPLTRIEALTLEDTRFHRDVDQLIELLETIVPAKKRSPFSDGRNYVTGILVALAAVLAIALFIWSMKPAKRPIAVTDTQQAKTSAQVPANVSGTWQAAVKYGWGDTHNELFKFDSDGHTLTGTASYLGGGRGDRGILDGKIHESQISFMTKSYTEFDNKTYEEKHYYLGTVSGDQISFTLQTDSGYDSEVPQKFIATRVAGK